MHGWLTRAVVALLVGVVSPASASHLANVAPPASNSAAEIWGGASGVLTSIPADRFGLSEPQRLEVPRGTRCLYDQRASDISNDPVNRRDPTGRIAPLILAGLAIAGGALATYVTPAGIDTPNPNQAYADNALFIMAGVSKWLLPIAGLVGLQSDVETGHGMDLVAVGGAGAAISGGVSSAARALSFGPGISSAVNEAFASYARESSGPGFWAAEEVAAASAGPLKNLSGSLDDAAAKARGVYPVPGAPGPAPRLPDFNGPWRDVPDNFRWGNYLKRLLGDGPPAGMFDPHAHHILFKEGNGAAQQSLVSEGQAILRNQAGIDPIFGQENLVWAPNGVPGQHGPEALEAVLLRLRALNAANASPEAYRQALRELGQTAASRTR